MPKRAKQVVCVENAGYEASLRKLKRYVTVKDAVAEKAGFVRVIDDSGEEYLYPKTLFAGRTRRLENDPRFLRRIEAARKSIKAGRGVRIEDV